MCKSTRGPDRTLADSRYNGQYSQITKNILVMEFFIQHGYCKDAGQDCKKLHHTKNIFFIFDRIAQEQKRSDGIDHKAGLVEYRPGSPAIEQNIRQAAAKNPSYKQLVDDIETAGKERALRGYLRDN